MKDHNEALFIVLNAFGIMAAFSIAIVLAGMLLEKPKPPQCTCGPECEWVREATPRKDLR